MAVLGLRFCARAFSSWRRAGATLRCGARASHCGGFSRCRARALGARASVAAAHELSSRGSRALECRLCSSYSAASGIFPEPGIEPVSPALAGRFLTTAPPGKSPNHVFKTLFLLSGPRDQVKHIHIPLSVLKMVILCFTDVRAFKAQRRAPCMLSPLCILISRLQVTKVACVLT